MRRSSLSRAGLLVALALTACLAPPPAVSVGPVRAASLEEADSVAGELERLRPRLLACLPDAVLPAGLEVWMQDEPHLYHRALEGSTGAEGLFSPDHRRILLSRHVEDRARVLAHELGHAALGPSWRPLTGTLEEGLCDVLAAELVPEQALRLRAGRLSSAALACGGLRLGLEVRDGRPREGVRLGWSAQITLTSEEETPRDPLELFRVRAGLTSTPLRSSVKRGYYGLAFLVVERIGLDRLHALCERATAAGHARLPRSWVLREAGLDDRPASWRRAAAAALGEGELRELVRLYPASVANAIAHHLRGRPGTPEERWEALEGEVWLSEGDARLSLAELGFLRGEVLSRL